MNNRYLPHILGIATFLFQALMNACVKEIGADISAFLVMGVRCLTGLAVFYPAIYLAGGFKKVMITRHPRKQLSRAFLSFFGVTCSFYAVQLLPLGDAAALWNTYGFFLLLLSAPILHERISMAQYGACAVGFLGVILIAQPHGTTQFVAIGVMLASALASAAGTLTVRLMSREDKELTILTWFFTASSLYSFTCWMIFADKQPPEPRQWIYLVIAGIFGSFSQLCMTTAFRHLGAERMGSYTYSGIVFSAIIGFFAFDEVPTSMMIAGAVLIVIGIQLSRYFNRHKTITL